MASVDINRIFTGLNKDSRINRFHIQVRITEMKVCNGFEMQDYVTASSTGRNLVYYPPYFPTEVSYSISI